MDLISTVVVTLVAILTGLWALLKYINGNEDYWRKQGIFQVNIADLFSLKDLLMARVSFQDIDTFLYKALKQKKGIKFGGTTLFRHSQLYIMDLDVIKNILVKDFDHFKNRLTVEFSDANFKKLLFNMVNQEWKDTRAILSPTFTTSKIKRMFDIFNESATKMIKFLNDEIKQNGPEVELRDVCGRYTMDVIASTAFGVDSQNFKDVNAPFAANGRKLQDSFLNTKVMLKLMLNFLSPRLSRKVKVDFLDVNAVNFLENVVQENIKRRKEHGEKRNDFLQLMIEVQDEQLTNEGVKPMDQLDMDANNDLQNSNKAKLTDESIRAQCLSFFFAGFDVIESFLIWSCYELALHPEIQERLFDELRLATNGNQTELSYDVVNKLQYLDMVVSETLRKYPTAIRSDRKCNKDYQIPDDTFVIRKDTHIIVPAYAIHHDPEIYPDPEKFDPERFSESGKSSRHPYAYLPFGVGPRMCIGNRFALSEGKAAMANLIMNFKMSPGKKTDIPAKFNPQGLLKPLNGCWLNLEARN